MSDDKPTLMECPVCGGKVSSDAGKCPHCGHPMTDFRKAAAEKLHSIKDAVGDLAGEAKKAVGSEKAKEGGRKVAHALVGIVKFVLWIFLAGFIGTFAKIISEIFLEKGAAAGWVSLMFFYPIFSTIPMIALARVLVADKFARIISAICSLTCVPSAMAIYGNMQMAGVLRGDTKDAALMGMFFAFAWSVFFIVKAKGDPKVMKRVRIFVCVLNGLLAAGFVVTECM